MIFASAQQPTQSWNIRPPSQRVRERKKERKSFIILLNSGEKNHRSPSGNRHFEAFDEGAFNSPTTDFPKGGSLMMLQISFIFGVDALPAHSIRVTPGKRVLFDAPRRIDDFSADAME